MRKISARKRTMMTAADTMDQARPMASILVEGAQRRLGSRMAAYDRVASSVGVSPSWLRKLIGRQPGLALAAHEFENLKLAYRSFCERIEADAEQERQRYLALGRVAHAGFAGDPQAMGLETGAGEEGSRQTVGLVPSVVGKEWQ
jgi:hypothetical protein